MKMTKFAMIAAVSLGIAGLSTACTEDTERPDSMFWIGEKPVSADNGFTTGDGKKGGNGNGFGLESGDNGFGDENGENNKAGEYGEFNPEDQDYVDGFGRKITNAPDFMPVYFPFDTFAVAPTESAKISAIVTFLKTNSGTGVVIEGNCDERGTQEYNRALGERRASAVKDELVANGISEDRIRTLSYGEDKPAVSGSNNTAWQRNRRADFVPVLMNK